MREKFEKSKADGAHHIINSLVGEWEGITKTWFEAGKLADESPIKGKIKSLLHGRFVMHEYSGSLEGKPFEGIAIYGYSYEWEKFQCAWVDSFHMGSSTMLAEGNNIDKGFSVTGTYGSTKMEQQWGWRTELEVINEDQIIITADNISPEGEEAKALETIYRRKNNPNFLFNKNFLSDFNKILLIKYKRHGSKTNSRRVSCSNTVFDYERCARTNQIYARCI